MNSSIEAAGQAIVDGVKQRMGALWDQLSDADRELIGECGLDAANLQVKAMASGGSDAATTSLAAEQRQITAQFANIAAGNAEAVKSAFLDTLKTVAGIALQVALKAI